jgi:hypothetical protein
MIEMVYSKTGWNEKYGVMIFKANRGYQSAMNKIVKEYTKKAKQYDSDIMVLKDIDDNNTKIWIVGNKYKIKEMVDDYLIPS